MTTLVSHQSKSSILLNKMLPSTDENMHNEYNWIHSKYYTLTIQYKVIDSTISNNISYLEFFNTLLNVCEIFDPYNCTHNVLLLKYIRCHKQENGLIYMKCGLA